MIDKKDILRNRRVLNENGFTNAGVLFFAKNPYKYVFSSRVRCVLFKGNDRVDILDKKEVDKGIIDNIEFAINYLKEHVPARFEIKGVKRQEFPKFPENAYREAIVNAIIHRDYFESDEVAVEKFSDIIIINNPDVWSPHFPWKNSETELAAKQVNGRLNVENLLYEKSRHRYRGNKAILPGKQ